MSKPFKYDKDKNEIWLVMDSPKLYISMGNASQDTLIYERELTTYNSRPHFPVSPEPDWEDGKIVEEGKDYKLEWDWIWKGGTSSKYIAIPLPKEPERTWEDNKRFVDQISAMYNQSAEQQDIPMEKDPFIEKQLQRIKEKSKDFLIHEHIEKMWGGLEMASIQHFIDKGKISGSFRNRLIDLIEAAQRYKMNFSQSPKEEKES